MAVDESFSFSVFVHCLNSQSTAMVRWDLASFYFGVLDFNIWPETKNPWSDAMKSMTTLQQG